MCCLSHVNVLFSFIRGLVNKSVEVCHFRQLATIRDLERILAIFHQAHMQSCANETFAITDVETKIRSVVNLRDANSTTQCSNDASPDVSVPMIFLQA